MLNDCFSSEVEFGANAFVGVGRDANRRVVCEEHDMKDTLSLVKLNEELLDEVRGMCELETVNEIKALVCETL